MQRASCSGIDFGSFPRFKRLVSHSRRCGRWSSDRFVPTSSANDSRDGFVLVIVLICTACIGLAAYTLAEVSLAEAQITATRLDLKQARLAAESTLELAAALVEQNHAEPTRLTTVSASLGELRWRAGEYSFRGILVSPSEETQPLSKSFGLEDHSRRFPLQLLPLDPADEDQARAMLLHLPGMTLPLADSLLDWMDTDDLPRQFGAEASYYTSLGLPRPPNRIPTEIEQLLSVRGMTVDLFNGTNDFHRNAGLRRYLTVQSAVFAGRADGLQKINLNQDDLVDLYDRVAEKFGESTARFIVAFRIGGPTSGANRLRVKASANEALANARTRAERQSFEEINRSSGTIDRGGIDLSLRPAYRIRTLFDLFGTAVRMTVDGKDTVLKSPWSGDASTLRRALRELDPWLSCTSDSRQIGFVSVSTAPIEVLRMVPEITDEIASGIVTRQTAIQTSSANEYREKWSDLTWMLREGLVTIQQLRDLAPYLTVQGDVFQASAVASTESLPTPVRLTAVIDGTERPVAVRMIVEQDDQTAHTAHSHHKGSQRR